MLFVENYVSTAAVTVIATMYSPAVTNVPLMHQKNLRIWVGALEDRQIDLLQISFRDCIFTQNHLIFMFISGQMCNKGKLNSTW